MVQFWHSSGSLAISQPPGLFHNTWWLIPVIDSSSSNARQISGIWKSFSLHLYVDFPNHIHGHSLNLMICSTGCDVLSVSTSDLISDHFSLAADLQIPSNHSRTFPQTIKYRKLQLINIEAFKAFKIPNWLHIPKLNATGLAQQYDSVLCTLINLHAPLLTKISRQGLLTPGWLWYLGFYKTS